MPLRARLAGALRTALRRFSGEYSAAESAVRPDSPPSADPTDPAPSDSAEAPTVTRARLRRPAG